jgi:AcrR family transcriptional regulator
MGGGRKKTQLQAGARSKGEVTRGRIVEAAIRLFARDGYTNVSIRQIAKRVGITQAGVLRHFPEKRLILRAVLNFVLLANHTRVESLQNAEADARQSLIEHARGNIVWAFEYPEQAQFILLLYYCAIYDSEFAELYAQITDVGRGRISRWLHAGRREKLFSMEVSEIEMRASNIHSLLVGVIIDLLAGKRRGEKASVDHAMERFLSSLMFLAPSA